MKFSPGDDVMVSFDGTESRGEIIHTSITSGYVLCRILVDPEVDYGLISARLTPVSTVCVMEKNLRHYNPWTDPLAPAGRMPSEAAHENLPIL